MNEPPKDFVCSLLTKGRWSLLGRVIVVDDKAIEELMKSSLNIPLSARMDGPEADSVMAWADLASINGDVIARNFRWTPYGNSIAPWKYLDPLAHYITPSILVSADGEPCRINYLLFTTTPVVPRPL